MRHRISLAALLALSGCAERDATPYVCISTTNFREFDATRYATAGSGETAFFTYRDDNDIERRIKAANSDEWTCGPGHKQGN